MTQRVYDVTPEQLVFLWPEVEPLLAPLLQINDYYMPLDIMVLHTRGEVKVWVAIDPEAKRVDAAMVTQLVTYPRRRVCGIPYIAGSNMSAWKDEFLKTVTDFARAHGCSQLVGGFRRGWVRVGGFKEMGSVLVKEIGE